MLPRHRRARRLVRRSPAGTPITRPGVECVAPVDQAMLVPAAGRRRARGWLATFHCRHGGPGRGVRRHDHAAGVGRRRCCARSTSTSTWSAASPGGCGSTTRTSSPSTGSRFGYPDEVVAASVVRLASAWWRRARRTTGCCRLARPSSPVPSGLSDPPRRGLGRFAARSGPTRRGPASRLSSRRASRLSGWATYSPRITPDDSAIATEAAVISASSPCETSGAALGRAGSGRGRSRGPAASARPRRPRRPAAAPAAGRRRGS